MAHECIPEARGVGRPRVHSDEIIQTARAERARFHRKRGRDVQSARKGHGIAPDLRAADRPVGDLRGGDRAVGQIAIRREALIRGEQLGSVRSVIKPHPQAHIGINEHAGGNRAHVTERCVPQ